MNGAGQRHVAIDGKTLRRSFETSSTAVPRTYSSAFSDTALVLADRERNGHLGCVAADTISTRSIPIIAAYPLLRATSG